MTKLLRSELFLYSRECYVPLFILACPLFGAVFGTYCAFQYSLEATPPLFLFEIVLAFIIVVTLTFHFSRDNYDNTVRNRFIIGYTRAQFFIARFISGACVSMIMTVSALIGLIVTARDILAIVPMKYLIPMIPGIIAMNLVWTAVVTFATALITKKAVNEICLLILMLAVYSVSMIFVDSLRGNEYEQLVNYRTEKMTDEEVALVKEDKFEGYYFLNMDENLEEHYYKSVPYTVEELNTGYVYPPERYVRAFVSYTAPFGQSTYYVICWNYYSYPEESKHHFDINTSQNPQLFDGFIYFPLYSCGVIAAILACGLLIYRRKDIK